MSSDGSVAVKRSADIWWSTGRRLHVALDVHGSQSTHRLAPSFFLLAFTHSRRRVTKDAPPPRWLMLFVQMPPGFPFAGSPGSFWCWLHALSLSSWPNTSTRRPWLSRRPEFSGRLSSCMSRLVHHLDSLANWSGHLAGFWAPSPDSLQLLHHLELSITARV